MADLFIAKMLFNPENQPIEEIDDDIDDIIKDTLDSKDSNNNIFLKNNDNEQGNHIPVPIIMISF